MRNFNIKEVEEEDEQMREELEIHNGYLPKDQRVIKDGYELIKRVQRDGKIEESWRKLPEPPSVSKPHSDDTA